MAGRAGIRNCVFLGHCGSNEPKGMCMHECVRRTFGLNLRHVASDTLASWRILLVVRVLFQGGGAGSVGRKRTVTVEAEFTRRLDELCVVVGSVYVVTTEAGNPAPIHDALHKIVSLHSVFVRSAVREIVEVRAPQLALL